MWTLATVAVLVGLAAGCAGSDKPDPNNVANAESAGYRWAGQGDPGNFASAESFCRGTVSQASGSAVPIGGGGAGPIAAGAGPMLVPGGAQGSGPASQRSAVDGRRQMESCMRGQGWAKTEAAAPMPPGW